MPLTFNESPSPWLQSTAMSEMVTGVTGPATAGPARQKKVATPTLPTSNFTVRILVFRRDLNGRKAHTARPLSRSIKIHGKLREPYAAVRHAHDATDAACLTNPVRVLCVSFQQSADPCDLFACDGTSNVRLGRTRTHSATSFRRVNPYLCETTTLTISVGCVSRGQNAFQPANCHPADNNKREQTKQAEHRAPDERPEKSARTAELTFARSEADPDEDCGQSKRDRDPERAAQDARGRVVRELSARLVGRAIDHVDQGR